MTPARSCARVGCRGDAVATLTYAYADATAVVGPLAVLAEPHCYDLCAVHADRLSAPLGWEVLRLPDAGRGRDDLAALADAAGVVPSGR